VLFGIGLLSGRPSQFITIREWDVVMFSVSSVCVCVCLSVCNAQTFDNIDRESLFLVCRCVFVISVPSSYIKVIGSRSRSRSQEQKSCLRVLFADDRLRLNDVQVRYSLSLK